MNASGALHHRKQLNLSAKTNSAILLPRGQSLSRARIQGLQSRRQLHVLCMAQPRRIARIAAQVQREIGDMLVNDSVLAVALSPGRRTGESMRLSAIPSITHVYVSNDLQVVKVYISIYSDSKGKENGMRNLKSLEPYVRKMMAQRVPLRLTPEYRFEYDDMEDEMDLVERVIGKEDVARYKRELAAEFGEEEGEEEEADGGGGGFFDDLEEEEGEGKAAAAAAPGNEEEEEEEEWGEEEEEGEYYEISSSDVFSRKGPFDDLFMGEADGPLVMTNEESMTQRKKIEQKLKKKKIKKELREGAGEEPMVKALPGRQETSAGRGGNGGQGSPKLEWAKKTSPPKPAAAARK